MERRTFLQTAALSTLAAASLSPLSLGQEGTLRQRAQGRRQRRRQPEATKIPIAVQLYSARTAVSKDFAAALEAIAKMGYDGVEFYGGNYYGKEAKEVRKMLDDNGLKCSGSHTGLDQLRGDNFEKTAEIHKTLGAKFIIVPGGLPRNDLAQHKAWVDEFNAIAPKAKALDLYIGYHAHGYDAHLLDDVASWERFFDGTVPEVVHQMDIGNYIDGGGDPYKMIEKYKGRTRTVHLKETSEGAPIIGDGGVDWNRIFELCETVGGVEWYVVEDEKGPDSFERIEKCIVALRAMGK